MKAKPFFTLIALFLCYFAKAQQFNIKGQLYANKGGNAAYAVISLRSGTDNRLLYGTAADSAGKFAFSKINPGNYVLQVQAIGMLLYKQPIELKDGDLEFPSIRLKTDSAKSILNTITIAASKPFLRRELDRTVVDIANSVYANGENALRLFNEIPEVQVDALGNISFRGTETVTVYVNDVKLQLSGQQLTNYLQSIPSESIKSYEVYPVGGVQFDAGNNGAVINIVLKDEYNYGLSGTVGTSYQYTIPGFRGISKTGFGGINNNINFNYSIGKMTFQVGGSLYKGKQFDNEDVTQFYKSSNVYSYQANNTIYNNATFGSYRAGLDYRITNKQTLTVNFQDSFSPSHPSVTSTNLFSTGGQSAAIDSAVNTVNNETSRKNTSQVNILYRYKLDTIGSKLDIGYSYIYFNDNYTSDAIYNYSFPGNNAMDFSDDLSINNPTRIAIHTFTVNLVKKISKSLTYQAGAKYNISNTDNAITYYSGSGPAAPVDTQRSNTFKYDEKILAFYGALTKNWDKWGFKIGMRAENTNYYGLSVTTNQRISFNRWSLFPSVFLQNKINKASSVTLAYTRSITRPWYEWLNPFENIQNPFSIQEGNPFLLPYFTNTLELSWLLDSKYTFTMGYKKTSNQIASLLQNDGPVIISTYDNIGDNSNAYFSTYIPLTLLKWWELNTSLTLRYASLAINEPGAFRVESKFGQNIQVTSRFDLDKDFYAEVRGNYWRNQFNWIYVYDWKPQGGIDIDFKKSFINNKLTMTLNLIDPFNLKRIGYYDNEPGFTREVNEYIPTRAITFGITYNLKKGKKKVNREEINPQNGDEQNRLN